MDSSRIIQLLNNSSCEDLFNQDYLEKTINDAKPYSYLSQSIFNSCEKMIHVEYPTQFSIYYPTQFLLYYSKQFSKCLCLLQKYKSVLDTKSQESTLVCLICKVPVLLHL